MCWCLVGARGVGDLLRQTQEEAAGKIPPASVFLVGSTAGAPHLRSQDRICCRRFMIVVIRRLAEPVPSVARPGPVWKGPVQPSGIAYLCHPDRRQGACHAWYRTYSLSKAPLLSPTAAGRPGASRSLLVYYLPAPGQGCQQCDRGVIPSWFPVGASLSVAVSAGRGPLLFPRETPALNPGTAKQQPRRRGVRRCARAGSRGGRRAPRPCAGRATVRAQAGSPLPRS